MISRNIFLTCLFLSFHTFQLIGERAHLATLDIVYAEVDDKFLELDLYVPQYVEEPPLFVWIHGGGWREGDKGQFPFRWLAERHGYAVASINYRLSSETIFPAQMHDCKAAIRWLRANSSTYGYSVEKIAVAGDSAGGMLAALVGTSGNVEALEGSVGEHLNESSHVDAVIDFFGATDFILRSETQPSRANEPGSVVYDLLGGGADEKVELARLASAVTHVSEDDPPLLVIHGDSDDIVLMDQSEAIAKAYDAMGLEIDFVVIQGAGHGGPAFFENPELDQIILNFLDEHF
jgi:acetyl esterase/lipase